MLPAPTPSEPHRALRLATPDSLDALLWNRVAHTARAFGRMCDRRASATGSAALPDVAIYEVTIVTERQAIEETYFLGLRMNRGLELLAIKEEFGIAAVDDYREPIADLVSRGLLEIEDGWLRLTPQGRIFSNDVFAAFLRD